MASTCWQIVACVLAADFLTGLVHWWEDTYGLPTWPVLGQLVIEPNLEHHRKPGLMGSMNTFFDRWWQSAVLAGGVCLLAWLAGVLTWHLVTIGCLASLGNEVHAWSHRGGQGWLVKLLQDAAIVQSPAQHARHHRPPFDRYYCTLTNLTNAVLERIEFWRGLEAAIGIAGIRPKRMTAERGYW
jgi:ubiquitin-conjugating enzyme E2 variant